MLLPRMLRGLSALPLPFTSTHIGNRVHALEPLRFFIMNQNLVNCEGVFGFIVCFISMLHSNMNEFTFGGYKLSVLYKSFKIMYVHMVATEP